MGLPPDNDTFLRATWRGLWDHLPAVALGSFAFALLAAPAFLLWTAGETVAAAAVALLLVPAGWTTLLRHLDARLQEGALSPRELVQWYARFWLRSVLLALPGLAAAAVLVLLIALASAPPVALSVWLALAAGISITLIVALLLLNAFPLLALYDLSLGNALRNGFVLSARHISATLGLLSMGVLFGLAIARLTIALMFFAPGVLGLFLVAHCRMAVDEELNAGRS
jgi:uncharacterized membrane protein YesL